MTWSRLADDPRGFLWDTAQNRGVRLTVYLLVTAALFPSSRAILTAALICVLGVVWWREYRRTGSEKIYYLGMALGILAICYAIAYLNVTRVEQRRIGMRPLGEGIQTVRDGAYTGMGQGFRGPIEVKVTVEDHRITGIETLEYPDLISVLDNEVAEFKRSTLERGTLVPPEQPGMFRGAKATLAGYANAVESALSKGIPNFPRYSAFSSGFFNAILGTWPNRVSLNALAILFSVFLVFEYTFQSMLTPGTGRAINCYNCASCVGVCPVKEAEGVQFPMGLVLLTRLGDYKRVVELSKYCVGCGRCAQKCPIGNCGPLVISAAYQAYREQQGESASAPREKEAV